MNPSKRCNTCGTDLPLSDFHRHRGGLNPRCVLCGYFAYLDRYQSALKIVRESKQRHRAAVLAQMKMYRQTDGYKQWRKRRRKVLWAKRDKHAEAQISAKKSANNRKRLIDSYVKGMIHKQTGIPTALIRDELVDAKRAYLKVRRLIMENAK